MECYAFHQVKTLVCLKDLAREMQLSPRSVKRWCKVLGVPPTVPGHASHRWTRGDAQKLFERWKAYWQQRTYEQSNPSRRPSRPTL